MHWLIVVPFYFFAALSSFLALTLLGRLVRLKWGANALATAAVLLAVVAVAVPLSLDWIDVQHLSGRRLLALGAATLVLAALDTLLQSVLPLPLDRELSEF